jgi:glycosyltransferase involved in cell wall biosynthesis
MRVFHLCSDYSGTHLYRSSFLSLAGYCSFQTVYVPVRNVDLLDKYPITDHSKIKIIYSLVLTKWHRLFFKKKISDVYNDLESKTDFTEVDLVHAHFLFSDGAIAFEIKKKHGLGYVVTVRNTDINIFFKYLFHLRSTGLSILKEANAIIVLNPKYKATLLTFVPWKHKEEIKKKINVIPNGLDSLWIENTFIRTSKLKEGTIKILFVGEFSKNKNIENSIRAIEKLRNTGLDIEFILVGNYGENLKRIQFLQEQRKSYLKIIDRISDKEILLKWYRNADIFLMPSFYESFGLVYLEAMSQGCPVIFSKNQGIDGYFEEGFIGYSVEPSSVNSICEAIIKTIKNYSDLSKNCVSTINQFSWERVAVETYKVYNSI